MSRQPQPFAARTLLLGVCGSIAAYKAVYLVRLLTEAGARVQVVMTGAATRFVAPLSFESVSGQPVVTDLYALPANRHIELAETAHAAVVAPATADLLARHASGQADDALSTLLLALRGPLLVAPAMDGGMWEHPATQANVEVLRKRGVTFVGPEHGPLASGLTGPGRMAEPERIVEALLSLLAAPRSAARPQGAVADLSGERVVVTAGATREHLDPVRFLSNPSTGRMGFALAAEAARRGARVTLIAAPSELPTPPGVSRVDVVSAADMRDAVHARLPDATVLLMAAAVADFRPARRHPHKVKKGKAEQSLALERTEDILKGLDAIAPEGLIRVGFAAETRDVLAHARGKLQDKGLHLIVANDVSEPGSGFATDTNRVVLLSRDGAEESLPLLAKSEVAAAVLERVARLRRSG
ncbi:MAG: bifunctional phosphopantothenoylcysteine decarboxylase/phosphopantothenate--cysteine ligase CoaBC [Nitrospirota bacterium]|nr:bifunctional phosphopantothenoylcysteine decarboxylase/phosphopantothenate--cysteine ligase CoaBC [Nitrospirota bacterium]